MSEDYQGYDPGGESIQDILDRLNAQLKMIASTISDGESNTSQILQQADEISLKVAKVDYDGNTIASLINQTATTIDIIGSKLNLVGAVTVLSDITGNLGTITAGVVDGVTLKSLSLNSEVMITDGYLLNVKDLNNVTAYDRTYVEDGYVSVRKAGTTVRTAYWSNALNHSDTNATADFYLINSDVGVSLTIDYTSVLRVSLDTVQAYGDLGVGMIANSTYRISSSGRAYGIFAEGTTAGARFQNTNGTAVAYCGGWAGYGFYTTSDVYFGFVNTSAVDTTATNIYIRPSSTGEGRCTILGTTETYAPFRASAFPVTSLAEYKQDITIWNGKALDKIKACIVYDYQLKNDVANEVTKHRQGLVIGTGYTIDPDIVDDNGVDLYQMNAWSWKAIQELSEENTALKTKYDDLLARVQALEAK